MNRRKHKHDGESLIEEISSYIEKKAQKRHKKNYDIVYICRDGKYKKFKIPHDPDDENEAEAPVIDNYTADMIAEKNPKAPVDAKTKKAQAKAAAQARKADLKLKAARWKHHHGDRIDGRRLHKITGINRLMAFVMPQRCDALNTYADSFDITEVDKYCREKIKSGMTSFSMLHVLIAAYVRVVSQRPAINRFISGQEVYSRYSIDVSMTVKKTMSIDSPDTCIKVVFEPTDTIDDVYRKFNKVVSESIGDNADTGFDDLSGTLMKIPRWLLRGVFKFLSWLDYHGKLPLTLLDLSPFHGSMIITSMGSLGIKPIYHHIYNFGNLPIFISYGAKRTVVEYDTDGTVSRRKYIDVKVVTDERICDGYYYASAFKLMRRYVENPKLLETPPENVLYDVD